MKFQETFDFDYPADVILRMFGAKDYYLAKYRQMSGKDPEVLDSTAEGDRFSITIRHALDAARLNFPDFVKSRIGERLFLRQTDTWQIDQARGHIHTDIERVPVKITADLSLVDTNSGSRLVMDFEIDASVPLIGGKIEKVVADPIIRHTEKDLALTHRMAADYAHV